MIPETPSNSRLGEDHELRVVTVASERLGRSLAALIEAAAEKPCRPTELSKLFGINKDLASRVVTAIGTPDPLALAYAMPGPAPLRSLVRGAKRCGIRNELLHEADEAIDAFERMVSEQVGDKTGLNALVSTWLPEARDEMDATARQLIFRGASLVKGLMADVAVVSFVVHASANNPELCDTAMIGGWLGLKRIRPRVPMRFIARLAHAPEDDHRVFDARSSDYYDHFMRNYSDSPLPIERRELPERTEYWLDDRGVGPRSSARVFLTEFYPNNHPRTTLKPKNTPLRYFYSGIDVPVKTLILDVLVASDVWPGVAPELRVYDTAANGPASPNDPSRDMDAMPQAGEVRSMSAGVAHFRSALIPQYTEMVNDVVGAHGWSGSGFRGYRCQIEYPMYGSQITLVFDPFPKRNADGQAGGG